MIEPKGESMEERALGVDPKSRVGWTEGPQELEELWATLGHGVFLLFVFVFVLFCFAQRE